MRDAIRILFVLVAIALSGIVPTGRAQAATLPDNPFNPWGSITVLGSPAPAGTTVEALIGGEVLATMPGGTVLGDYSLLIPADDPATPAREGGNDGEIVRIRVGGKFAVEAPAWTSGAMERFDLTVVANRTLVVRQSPPACQIGDGEFTTIDEAIQNSNDSDSVVICPGTYNEHLTVSAAITITGFDTATTIISDVSTIFYTTADGVTIDGLTLTTPSTTSAQRIQVMAGTATILNNTITGSTPGIDIGVDALDTQVTGNTISATDSYGVRISGSSSHEVTGNEITSNSSYGILVENADDNLIQGNTLQSNGTGVSLRSSADNVLLHNVVSGNDNGIYLELGSINNTIRQNDITGNLLYDLYNDQPGSIMAEENWWGSVVCTQVDGSVFDNEEGQGAVDFDPLLSETFSTGTPMACLPLALIVDQTAPPCATGVATYTDISSAVAAAGDGDTVIVCPGLYQDNVVVSSQVTIQSFGGPGVTTIEAASPSGHVIRVFNTSNVTISGFTLTGTGSDPYSGVALLTATSCTVTGNIMTGNYFGLSTYNASGNTIYNNSFTGNVQNALDNGTNSWNITPVMGTNVIGGTWLGGNYWDDYAGSDTTGDGLGDTALPHNNGGNIAVGGDSHPLVYP
jgi:parallel beta-helix repeat protein